MCIYVTFVVFNDCEGCTRPISTNPVSMEAGEYGLTRGTCSLARRVEVVVVVGLLWNSWCVLGGADFSGVFFSIFFFPRTHTACCKYEAALPHLPLAKIPVFLDGVAQNTVYSSGCCPEHSGSVLEYSLFSPESWFDSSCMLSFRGRVILIHNSMFPILTNKTV